MPKYLQDGLVLLIDIGSTAAIPPGYTVSAKEDENTIWNGLVISNNATGEEFIWVPANTYYCDSEPNQSDFPSGLPYIYSCPTYTIDSSYWDYESGVASVYNNENKDIYGFSSYDTSLNSPYTYFDTYGPYTNIDIYDKAGNKAEVKLNFPRRTYDQIISYDFFWDSPEKGAFGGWLTYTTSEGLEYDYAFPYYQGWYRKRRARFF